MADSILIDLNEPVVAPEVDSSLVEFLVGYYEKWPENALCATQSSDGEVIWWQASKNEIATAVSEHKPINNELLPLIGISQVVDSDYPELENYPVCASDWREAIVGAEEFIAQKRNK